jgi:hypothetical protein
MAYKGADCWELSCSECFPEKLHLELSGQRVADSEPVLQLLIRHWVPDKESCPGRPCLVPLQDLPH